MRWFLPCMAHLEAVQLVLFIYSPDKITYCCFLNIQVQCEGPGVSVRIYRKTKTECLGAAIGVIPQKVGLGLKLAFLW